MEGLSICDGYSRYLKEGYKVWKGC